MQVAFPHRAEAGFATPGKGGGPDRAACAQIVQYDVSSVCLRLRTLEASSFLHLCWHSSSARLNMGDAPQRGSTAEAFGYGALDTESFALRQYMQTYTIQG